MNLENLIEIRLWEAIEGNYQSNDYTGAISDSLHFLSNLLRDKAGVELDGVALVGQALGGKTPLLKLNKLETETEKNIQGGIEQILRGIYQGIRNPRSHHKYTDTQQEADAIILFLNYIIQILDKSRSPFSKEKFLVRVFEKDFVRNDRYASLLVKEIPAKACMDIFLEAYRAKNSDSGKNLKFFFCALLKRLIRDDVPPLTGPDAS